MTSPPHVTAVVVTYNRAETLAQCLVALGRQTRAPQRLVVVDNASTDDTASVVTAAVEQSFAGTEVEVVSLSTNTGGAGGFAAGMQRALELGTDWVWTMDDDVAPAPDCLEVLLGYTDVSECVHPQRFEQDGTPQAWEPVHAVATGTVTFLDNVSFNNGKDVVFTNVACFEGALISRRIIELVGLPDPAYFIVGDDTVFGLKASAHTNVAIARHARMDRLLPVAEFAPWKVYYLTRNAFMVRTDACAYLGIEPTKVQNLTFAMHLALETSRYVRKAPAFAGPVLRGFRDGMAHARQRRRVPTPAVGAA